MTKEYYVDGSCKGNPGHMRIAILTPTGDLADWTHPHYPPREGLFGDNKLVLDAGEGTNNQAEYLALYGALHYAQIDRATDIVIKSDSKLVVEQVNGNWKVKNQQLKTMLDETLELLKKMEGEKKITITWVPREQNLAGHLLE